MGGIVGKVLPLGPAQAAVEGGGIETGRRPQRQHVAIDAVEDHGRAALLLRQALLDELLQPDVERADQFDAGVAFSPVKFADDAAQRVDLDLAGAGRSAQLRIVDLFQPALADPEAGNLQ